MDVGSNIGDNQQVASCIGKNVSGLIKQCLKGINQLAGYRTGELYNVGLYFISLFNLIGVSSNSLDRDLHLDSFFKGGDEYCAVGMNHGQIVL